MSHRFLTSFFIVAVAHLVAQATDSDLVAEVTQVLLMPTLAGMLATAIPTPHPRLVRWSLIALGLSWLGDSAPRLLDGDAAFAVMIAFFLGAQLAYAIGFWPLRGSSILAQRRWLLAPYTLVFVALLVACLPGAGWMAPAVVVYGASLLTMAVLATGVHPLAWAGGAVFMVSDGLIALDAFASGLPWGQDLAVMATYVVAQLLIVLGVLVRAGVGAPPRGLNVNAGRPSAKVGRRG